MLEGSPTDLPGNEEAPSASKLQAELEKAREEARATKDRMLRIAADADNQRKRFMKEREELLKFGKEQVFKELLPFLDNLERALASIPDASDDPVLKSVADGLRFSLQQVFDWLGKHQIKGFVALGQPFDPAYHEALTCVETRDVEPGTVVAEVLRGYLLQDRLLRPALVSVAKAPAATGAVGTGDCVPEDDPENGTSVPGSGR